MKQPAKEDWLILLRSTFATTQIMFTTVKVKVRPLLDLNAHLQTSCHLMQLQDDSCLIQDFLCLVGCMLTYDYANRFASLNNIFMATQLSIYNVLTYLFCNDIIGDDYAYIVCVGHEPRIQYCGEGTVFDPQVLTCVYFEQPGGHAPLLHPGPPHPAAGFGPF